MRKNRTLQLSPRRPGGAGSDPCRIDPDELWRLRRTIGMSLELAGFFVSVRALECIDQAPLRDDDDLRTLARRLGRDPRTVRRLTKILLERGLYVRFDGHLLRADRDGRP